MESQHILLLGATAATGLAFITHYLTLPPRTQPYLTLYIRPTATHKLPSAVQDPTILPPKLRIITGMLTSQTPLTTALSASSTFPKSTVVVSFLGAYLSLPPIFTQLIRRPGTPIAEAIRDVVLPTMRACGVIRILVLSTPTAINSVQEVRRMSWKWWLYTWLPVVAAPEGNAEMREIARVVSGGVLGVGMTGEMVDAARRKVRGGVVEWTVFRVPGLVDSREGGRDVVRVGMFGAGFDGGLTLTRQSLVRWVLEEVEDRRWVGGWPVVANA